jgi:hypothetical protein
MRIAFSGTANTGKTTLVRDFLTVWPMYSTPQKTYRDLIIENKISHSKHVSKDGQRAILDFMVEQMKGKTLEDCIVYDRCPLDNIVYSMWANEKSGLTIDDAFISECIKKVRESIKDLDIIFWLPYNENIPIAHDSMRETDAEYINEINNIFEVIYNQYLYNDKFVLFDKEDRPAIIPIFTSDRFMRIKDIASYIDESGGVVAPDDAWMQELQDTAGSSNPQEAVEELLKQQKQQLLKDTGIIVT